MCQKCVTKRERLAKLLEEDEVLSNEPQGTIATLAAFAVEKLLEEAGNDPFTVEHVLKGLLAMAVAKTVRKQMEDPDFLKTVEETQKDLEESLQRSVLENMPEPKVLH